MKSRKDLFKILQSYQPYLSQEICNHVYSYICRGQCSPTKDGWCSRCGIGCKYHYYDKYQNSTIVIQQWLNKYYYSKHRCCELMYTHKIYGQLYRHYCKKRIPRKLYQQYKSYKCHNHLQKHIDIFGVYRKPNNENYHYEFMMSNV